MDPLRQQQIAMKTVEVFLAVEEEILLNIARLLASGKGLLDEDIERWQVEKLSQLGKLSQQNIVTIARNSGLSIDAVTEMLSTVGYEAVNEGEADLQEAVRSGALIQPPPVKDSKALETILITYQAQAKDTFNLINTTMLNQSQQVYIDILNETTGKMLTGTVTSRQALRETVTRWSQKGIPALIDKSGRQWSTEAYINTVTRSMSQSVTREMQFARMDEYGSDLIEVSSHSGARPKCAKFQGRIFSRSGKHSKYPPLSSTSYGEPDGLFGINCHHVFYPFVEGFSRKLYKPYPAEENKRVYEESQKQRQLERRIKEAKREMEMLRAMKDFEGAEKAKRKVLDRQATMRAFINDTGRTRRYEREQIYT